jgi:transposase
MPHDLHFEDGSTERALDRTPLLAPVPGMYNSAGLSCLASLQAEYGKLHRLSLRLVREDTVCRRFMTVPGVCAMVAVTYKTAIDDPARFRKSKDLGPYFGLTPSKYQSGEVDLCRDHRIARGTQGSIDCCTDRE